MQYVIDILNKVIPVLIAGLFFGAGLPALYALGLRLLAGRTEYTADGKLVEIEPSGNGGEDCRVLHFCYYRSNCNHRYSLGR